MESPLIKGLYITCNRKPGKPVRWYVYAWRGGPLLMKKEGGERPKIGAAEIALYQKALADRTSSPAGTMAALADHYRKSQEWKALAPSTRRNWDIVVDRIVARWGKSPVSIWSDPRMVTKVIAWRDGAAETPRAADNGITVLRHLLEWARLRGRVTVNVAAGIPRLYQGGERAEIIWTADDIACFRKSASQPVQDAIELACLTGLRRADLVTLTWDHVGDTAIILTAQKSSRKKRRRVVIPITSALRALLAELRARPRKDGTQTVLVNSFGEGWSADGLGQRIIAARDKADIRHSDGRKKHLHDCRGTFATNLILAGLTDQEAAGILGWAPERVANIRHVYVDRERVIVALADRLERATVNQTVNQPGARK